MKTKIVAAFPGTGKTYYHEMHKDTTLDSDSSKFSWIKDADGNNTLERNPEFPDNYIKHIKDNIGKYEFIFVSTHEQVRYALKDNNLFFYYIVPDKWDKDKFLERYANRGNTDKFIQFMDDNWGKFYNEFDDYPEEDKCEKVKMISDYLEDELRYLSVEEFDDWDGAYEECDGSILE